MSRQYLIRRLLLVIPAMLGISVVLYTVLALAPGDPFGAGGPTRQTIGVVPNHRGQIDVNEHYQTAIPHIYAAGDVIGFPALSRPAILDALRRALKYQDGYAVHQARNLTDVDEVCNHAAVLNKGQLIFHGFRGRCSSRGSSAGRCGRPLPLRSSPT